MKFIGRYFLFSSTLILVTVIGWASWGQNKRNPSPVGLGLILGDPSGVSMKTKLQDGQALDGLVSYGSGPASTYYLAGSYQFEKPSALHFGKQPVDFYYGLGIRIHESGPSNDRKLHLGPKVPAGLSIKLVDTAFEVFAEAAFVLDITPSTSGDIDGGIGARYWF